MLVGLCFTADEWRELDDAVRTELIDAASGPTAAPAPDAGRTAPAPRGA